MPMNSTKSYVFNNESIINFHMKNGEHRKYFLDVQGPWSFFTSVSVSVNHNFFNFIPRRYSPTDRTILVLTRE